MAPEKRESFYSNDGLNTETYDARAALHIAGSPVEGDVEFYVEHARRIGGPVLDVGCGTGRVAIALASDGHEVTGIDLSQPMLRLAEQRRAALLPAVRSRLTFQCADMTDFSLGREFPLIVTPFRSFQALLTSEAQRAALSAFRRHLHPQGELILDLFDPRLEWCAPDTMQARARSRDEVRHPTTGNRVTLEVVERSTDPIRQVIEEIWRIVEAAGAGRNCGPRRSCWPSAGPIAPRCATCSNSAALPYLPNTATSEVPRPVTARSRSGSSNDQCTGINRPSGSPRSAPNSPCGLAPGSGSRR